MKKSKTLQNAERDLSRAVKNFNAVLQRAIKSGRVPESVAPERESVRKIKQAAQGMADAEKRAFYREQIRTLKKIKLKTAFDVVESPSSAKATKFEVRRAKSAVRTENARRAERAESLKKAPVTSGGKEVKGAQRVADRANLKPIRFEFGKKTSSDWKKFRQAYRKAEKPFGAEYIRSLKKAVENHCPAKWAKIIKSELDKIGAAGIERAYNDGQDFADVDWWYSPDRDHTEDLAIDGLCKIRIFRITDYYAEWRAKLDAVYTARITDGAERKADFMNDVRRFGARGLALALEHRRKWALLEFHDRGTREKFYETWGGIEDYI